MIKETLKIFSQNVRKNKTLMNIILENSKNTMDVILVQEPPKSLIRRVPSHSNPLGDPNMAPLITLTGPYLSDKNQLRKTIQELQHMSTRN